MAAVEAVPMPVLDARSTQRLSRNPLPSNIAGIAFSIRAVRVADCLAAAKWYK